MSEEIKFQYFLNGELVNKEDVNFDQDLQIRVVDNKVHIFTNTKEDENE